ncbi:MAG: ISAca5, transposase [Bryobacterales bacterium]|nr:ISAca5, transposase [Bryobacterales bacterium]
MLQNAQTCGVLARFARLRFQRLGPEIGLWAGMRANVSGGGFWDARYLTASVQCDSYRRLRCLLVECAHHVLRKNAPDCMLKRWGQRLCERGGKNSRKRALVAVARKLGVLLHKLWVTGTEYDPLFGCPKAERSAA